MLRHSTTKSIATWFLRHIASPLPHRSGSGANASSLFKVFNYDGAKRRQLLSNRWTYVDQCSTENDRQRCSDAVLEGDASPRGCLEAENFDALASWQLARYFIGLPRPQKNCLCLASASLSRSHLGIRLPWLVLIAAAPVATVTLNPYSLLIFMFTVSFLLSHFPTVYFLHLVVLVYGILVRTLPRHYLGLLLPRLEH